MKAPSHNETAPIVILGAGPAGLAAALTLCRAGRKTLVLEAGEVVGGLSRTLHRDGFAFDLGGHRWFTKIERVDRFVRNLMGDELIVVDRSSEIIFRGRHYRYPVRIRDVLRNVGVPLTARALMAYGIAHARTLVTRRQPRTMEEAFVAQFGRTLYEMFFANYSSKVWGRPCAEMASAWVSQRTRGMSLWTAVLHALRLRQKHVASLSERFLYPRHGFGRIPERMAEEVRAEGGSIHLGEKVVSVELEEGRINRVETRDRRQTTHDYTSSHVISTIPLQLLVGMLRPAAPDEVTKAGRRLSYRNLVTVNLMLEGERLTPHNWVYVHDPERPYARFHEPKNWSPEMAPPGACSVVVEYFCDESDSIWTVPEEDLVRQTAALLGKDLGIPVTERLRGGFVARLKRAYPIYDLGYEPARRSLLEFLAPIHNLDLAGRGGTFRYDNSDHAIEAGILAAENILGARHDLDQVNRDPGWLEEKRLA